MKLRATSIALFLAGFAGAAAAGHACTIMQQGQTINLLSQATGLTPHEVQMVLGPSANYEYPVRYATASWRFRRALGRTLYEQILGQGSINAQQVQELNKLARARQTMVAADK